MQHIGLQLQTLHEADPEAARAEYGAQFRDDIADYITRETVEAVTCPGRKELPPSPGVEYAAFCDPSGGVSDAMTLAIGHLGKRDMRARYRAGDQASVRSRECGEGMRGIAASLWD
jgi:hypothetical protein